VVCPIERILINEVSLRKLSPRLSAQRSIHAYPIAYANLMVLSDIFRAGLASVRCSRHSQSIRVWNFQRQLLVVARVPSREVVIIGITCRNHRRQLSYRSREALTALFYVRWRYRHFPYPGLTASSCYTYEVTKTRTNDQHKPIHGVFAEKP